MKFVAASTVTAKKKQKLKETAYWRNTNPATVTSATFSAFLKFVFSRQSAGMSFTVNQRPRKRTMKKIASVKASELQEAEPNSVNRVFRMMPTTKPMTLPA